MPAAVNWYVAQGRVHPARNSAQAMLEMVRAWAYDVADGRDALLVAYHRDAVESLNRAARQVWEKLGQLSGPELEAPGGRRYRAGDRVITLSPGPGGAWVTSQRAVVTPSTRDQCSLVAVTPEGTELHMGPEDIGADKLGYSFAVTAHRSQGATVDVTYALEDGGGRELAYVAMSRAEARATSTSSPRHPPGRPPPGLGLGPGAPPALGARPGPAAAAGPLVHRTPGSAAPRSRRTARPTSTRPDANCATAEQDAADLRAGTGRWAYSPAGLGRPCPPPGGRRAPAGRPGTSKATSALGEAQGSSPAEGGIGSASTSPRATGTAPANPTPTSSRRPATNSLPKPLS